MGDKTINLTRLSKYHKHCECAASFSEFHVEGLLVYKEEVNTKHSATTLTVFTILLGTICK